MHTIEVNGKYLQSIEDLKAIIGKTVLFRYPKNPQGHRFFQTGRVVTDIVYMSTHLHQAAETAKSIKERINWTFRPHITGDF